MTNYGTVGAGTSYGYRSYHYDSASTASHDYYYGSSAANSGYQVETLYTFESGTCALHYCSPAMTQPDCESAANSIGATHASNETDCLAYCSFDRATNVMSYCTDPEARMFAPGRNLVHVGVSLHAGELPPGL